MTKAGVIPFDNSYVQLPDDFYHPQPPETVPAPALIRCNDALARFLGIDPEQLRHPDSIAALAGNGLLDGSEPIATVYAGHQFGGWNPQLGDGRAILLGEVVASNGQRFDIQLKGSGRTPFSRGGDGKSPLGPVLREYIVSEAMAALGIPTTRSLAAVSTGEMVFREAGGLPGAVLTRVASSHIRVGTVQYFAARENLDALRQLVDYTLARHFPDRKDSDNPALALLSAVVEKQAELIPLWLGVGFIHGVMNTDNMLLCGETIDYGPCAFLEEYHPGTVFSPIDHQGRYAYGNQPAIANWNLAQLAQALLPLIDDDKDQAVAGAQQAINRFPELFFSAYHRVMARKLGIGNFSDDDEPLYQDLLEIMEQEKADFTLAFRRLNELAGGEPENIADIFDFSPAFDGWLDRWRERLAQDILSDEERHALMRAANPVFIPRNHRVEEAIDAAQKDGNLRPFNALMKVLAVPFDYREEDRPYMLPAKPQERVLRTFCGT